MAQSLHEMKSSGPRLETTDAHAARTEKTRDAYDLARAGKKEVLKRRFSLLSMTGFSCVLTATWEAVLDGFALGLVNGGPAGLVYGYLLAWAGTLSVFIAMSELASMLPTAGGQYHWVNVLAPRRAQRVLSYLTGWATAISWVAAATAGSYLTATILQATIVFNVSSYTAPRWQGTLIQWGILLLSTIITTSLGKLLPLLEVLLLLLHVLGFVGTLIPLAYNAGTRGGQSATQIFATFYDLGGWNSIALSFLIGIQGNATAFLGTDGSIHMSEEVENSAVNVPRAIITSIILNGVLGFVILLGVLFAVDDLKSVAEKAETYPFIAILANSLDNDRGATAIASLIVFINLAVTIGSLSSASRILWSLARDRGVPGWQWLRLVDRHTSIPYNTVYVTAITAGLLGFINIGSTTVFQDLISIVLEGFYLSYLLAISLLLYRRMRNEIGEAREDDMLMVGDEQFEPQAPNDKPYIWGPWRLRRWTGNINNMVGCCYLITIGFFCFWPSTAKVNSVNMNYSSLVLGGVLIFSTIWYFVAGRKQYLGPVVEVSTSTQGLTSP